MYHNRQEKMLKLILFLHDLFFEFYSSVSIWSKSDFWFLWQIIFSFPNPLIFFDAYSNYIKMIRLISQTKLRRKKNLLRNKSISCSSRSGIIFNIPTIPLTYRSFTMPFPGLSGPFTKTISNHRPFILPSGLCRRNFEETAGK